MDEHIVEPFPFLRSLTFGFRLNVNEIPSMPALLTLSFVRFFFLSIGESFIVSDVENAFLPLVRIIFVRRPHRHTHVFNEMRNEMCRTADFI